MRLRIRRQSSCSFSAICAGFYLGDSATTPPNTDDGIVILPDDQRTQPTTCTKQKHNIRHPVKLREKEKQVQDVSLRRHTEWRSIFTRIDRKRRPRVVWRSYSLHPRIPFPRGWWERGWEYRCRDEAATSPLSTVLEISFLFGEQRDSQ